MNRSVIRLLLIGAISALLAACAAPTQIATNKATSYTKEPRRIFVLTNVGSEFGSAFNASFQQRLKAIAMDCGAEMQIAVRSALELDEGIYTKMINAYRPDSVLTVHWTGGGTKQNGILILAIYDVRLIDKSAGAVVWRANTTFSRGSPLISLADRGEAFAIDLTNKMKADQILRSCQPIKPKT